MELGKDPVKLDGSAQGRAAGTGAADPAQDTTLAEVRSYLLGLQDRIVTTMQAEEGRPFVSDGWTREPGGRLEGEPPTTTSKRRSRSTGAWLPLSTRPSKRTATKSR